MNPEDEARQHFLLRATPTKWRELIRKSKEDPRQSPMEKELCEALESSLAAHTAHREIGARQTNRIMRTQQALIELVRKAIASTRETMKQDESWPDEIVQAATLFEEDELRR